MPTPGGTNPPIDDALANARLERNHFYHSLAPRAQEAFLAELDLAKSQGADDETAWMRAARAAEVAYEGNP
jgi:hypothetical protein